MDPAYLAYLGVLVMVGANKSRFKPAVKAIMGHATTRSIAAKAGSSLVRQTIRCCPAGQGPRAPQMPQRRHMPKYSELMSSVSIRGVQYSYS